MEKPKARRTGRVRVRKGVEHGRSAERRNMAATMGTLLDHQSIKIEGQDYAEQEQCQQAVASEESGRTCRSDIW